MARHNLCPNPAISVDITGWSGGTVPARVTGLVGYNRPTGARYTGGSFLRTPACAAGPGDTVTVAFDILTEAFDDPSIDLYLYATRSAGGDVQVGAIDHPTLTHNVVSRFAITRACPALTTGVYALADGINMVISPTIVTACLAELSPTADTYFDGDVPGPPTSTWDGATGLSTSTYNDAPPGTPAPEWTAGQPRTAWRAGNVRTNWSAGNPRIAWTAGNVRTGG